MVTETERLGAPEVAPPAIDEFAAVVIPVMSAVSDVATHEEPS